MMKRGLMTSNADYFAFIPAAYLKDV